MLQNIRGVKQITFATDIDVVSACPAKETETCDSAEDAVCVRGLGIEGKVGVEAWLSDRSRECGEAKAIVEAS